MDHLGKRTDYYPSLNETEVSKLKFFKNHGKMAQKHQYSQIEGPSRYHEDDDNLKHFGSLKRAKYQNVTPGAVM